MRHPLTRQRVTALCGTKALLLALLISNCAGSFASRLTGSLTSATAALSSGLLKVSLVDCGNMLHKYILP